MPAFEDHYLCQLASCNLAHCLLLHGASLAGVALYWMSPRYHTAFMVRAFIAVFVLNCFCLGGEALK